MSFAQGYESLGEMLFVGMMPDRSDAVLIAILGVGIFVQSAAGFAAGLLIVPAMLWCGYTIPEAQTSLLIATLPQNAWGVWMFRDALVPQRLVWPGLARLVFLPLGLGALRWLESFSVVTLRQLVGGLVLAATLSTILIRPRRLAVVPAIWSWFAFPVSGFFQGLVGMGGPPMVLWVQAHDWDTRQSRVFLFSMYLISIAPAIIILIAIFGRRVIDPAVATIWSLPVLLLISWLGLRTGTWLGTERLRTVTFAMLLLMGLAGLAAPWLTTSLRM